MKEPGLAGINFTVTISSAGVFLMDSLIVYTAHCSCLFLGCLLYFQNQIIFSDNPNLMKFLFKPIFNNMQERDQMGKKINRREMIHHSALLVGSVCMCHQAMGATDFKSTCCNTPNLAAANLERSWNFRETKNHIFFIQGV